MHAIHCSIYSNADVFYHAAVMSTENVEKEVQKVQLTNSQNSEATDSSTLLLKDGDANGKTPLVLVLSACILVILQVYIYAFLSLSFQERWQDKGC